MMKTGGASEKNINRLKIRSESEKMRNFSLKKYLSSKIKDSSPSHIFAAALMFVFVLAAVSTSAQTGGPFTIEKSIVSSGGGTVAGGQITIESSFGQPLAGSIQGGQFTFFSGFITPTLAPTAANVAIGGRVRTSVGAGIRNALVMLTDASGATRFAQTGEFGAYRFERLAAGETYILTVSARRFVFTNPTHVVTAQENLDNLDFTAAVQ